MAIPARTRNSVTEFFAGTGLLLRGFGLMGRSPRLLLLGLAPGAVALGVVLTALGFLVYFAGDLAARVTWFADDWSPDARDAIRAVAVVALVGGSLVVAVLTFTVLTITIGDPFYEAISSRVDARFGGAGTPEPPWYRTLPRNLVDSARLLLLSLVTGVVLFVLGLTPLIGQTVVPVLGALAGGWLLAVEISGVPFNRRGLRLRERRRLLRGNWALALGFGVPVFLAFVVPFVAVLVMPGAVAGATLLARRVLGQPYE